MIAARGIRKRFGRLTVLNGIDLNVARGSVTAIVGPNASGKTTLNRIILGLVRADAGEITFDGKRLDGDAAYRARIGYMPQKLAIDPTLPLSVGLALASGLYSRLGIFDDTIVGFVGLENWRFLLALYIGDTITVRLTVAEKRVTSKPERGIVKFDVEILNQRQERLQQGKIVMMMLRRPVPTLVGAREGEK